MIISSIRGLIDAELAQPLSEKEWISVQNGEFLTRLQRGEIFPAGIAESVRQFREAYGGMPEKKIELKAVPAREARADLLSFYVSRGAEHLDFVREFRTEVLNGKLLPVGDVENWVNQHWARESYTVWARIGLPKRVWQQDEIVWDEDHQSFRTKSEVASLNSFKYTPGVLEVEYQWLHYNPPGRPSEIVMVAEGGKLDRLRICSERLAQITKASPAEATTFILSGEPLKVPACRQTLSYGPNRLAALNRIRLDIDPTLSPREVASIYREMRTQVFKGRYRAMSEKHTRLALFTLSRGAKEALKTAMRDWNKQNRRWRYKTITIFGRDRLAAVRRANTTLASPGTTQDTANDWLMGASAETSKANIKKEKRKK